MLRSNVNSKFFEQLAREFVFGQHALDCVHNKKLGSFRPEVRNITIFLSTHVAAVEHILLLLFLISRQLYFFSIYHDDIVSCINVWSEDRFVATSLCICHLHGKSSKYLVRGVYDSPVAVGFCTDLSQGCFHGERIEKNGLQ